MNKTIQAAPKNRNKAFMKAAILIAFIVLAIFLVRFTPFRGYLTAEEPGRLLDSAGVWAPFVYMVLYAVGVCLFLPGTLLTGLGAAIFGPYWGFLYVWIGAMLGASAAFITGRTLGREFAASLIGGRLKKNGDIISRSYCFPFFLLPFAFCRIYGRTAPNGKLLKG